MDIKPMQNLVRGNPGKLWYLMNHTHPHHVTCDKIQLDLKIPWPEKGVSCAMKLIRQHDLARVCTFPAFVQLGCLSVLSKRAKPCPRATSRRNNSANAVISHVLAKLTDADTSR